MNQLARDAALNNIVAHWSVVANCSGCNSHHGAQALATGNDEMRGEFVEMCVTGFYRRQ